MNKNLLIIPLSGHGSRFSRIGVKGPKQLLRFDDGSYPLVLSLSSIKNIEQHFTIFTCKSIEHKILFENILKMTDFYAKLKYVFIVTGSTDSPVETIISAINKAENYLNDEKSATIFTMDIQLPVPINLPEKKDVTFVFETPSGPHSYVSKSKFDGSLICEERRPISTMANAGIYCVSTLKKLKLCLKQSLDLPSKSERSIAEAIINSKLTNFTIDYVNELYLFGTPEEWVYHNDKNIPLLNSIKERKILILCDHSANEFGFNLERKLTEKKFEVIKLKNKNLLPWNQVIELYKNELISAYYETDTKIFVCCMSGQGMSKALGKILGVHVPVVSGTAHLELAFSHSNARAISLAAMYCDNKEFLDKIDETLNTFFQGGRHQVRQNEHLLANNKFSRINSKEDFLRGWFVGQFDPSLYTDPNVEIGIKDFTEGLEKPDEHFHTKGYEMSMVLQGTMQNKSGRFTQGEYYIQSPLEPDTNTFMPKTKVLIVRFDGFSAKKKFYDQ